MARVTDTREEEIKLTKYSGATADELHHMAKYYIDTSKPDNLIIVAGLNDILNERRINGSANCEGIAERVLDIGRTARTEGVGRVCISEILKPKFRECHANIRDTNNILKLQCEYEGFVFVSQSNIGVRDIGDLLHVSREGNEKLKHNILSQCYTYDKSY